LHLLFYSVYKRYSELFEEGTSAGENMKSASLSKEKILKLPELKVYLMRT
jgi:hypothetical protein